MMPITENDALTAAYDLNPPIDGWENGSSEATLDSSEAPVSWVFRWLNSEGDTLAVATVQEDGTAALFSD